MIFVYRGDSVPLRIHIFKGHSMEHEDFSRANLKVWLVNATNQMPMQYTVDEHNTIKCNIPSGLPVGAYSVKAIWSKNGNEHFSHNHCYAIPRSMNYAFTEDVFTATLNQNEATFASEGKCITVRMHVDTYGYDGLSAYELAVMRGKTTLSEEEWLDSFVSNTEVLTKLNYLQSVIRKYHPDADLVGDPIDDVMLPLNEKYVLGSVISIDAMAVLVKGEIAPYSGRVEVTDGEGNIILTAKNILVAPSTSVGHRFTPNKVGSYTIKLYYTNSDGVEYSKVVRTFEVVDGIVNVRYSAAVVEFEYSITSVLASLPLGATTPIVTRPTKMSFIQKKYTTYASGKVEEETVNPADVRLEVSDYGDTQFFTFNEKTGELRFGQNDGAERSVKVWYIATDVEGNVTEKSVVITQRAAETDEVAEVIYGVPTINLVYDYDTVGASENLVVSPSKVELTQKMTIVYQSGKRDEQDIHSMKEVSYRVSDTGIASVDATGKVMFAVNGTLAQRSVVVFVTAKGEDGQSCTNNFTIFQSAKVLPYYVGLYDTSRGGFAEIGKEDLVANATAYNTSTPVKTVVNKRVYYIMLPQTVQFKQLYYNAGIPQTINSLGSFETPHDVVVIDGMTYNVYAKYAVPSNIEYELTIKFVG